MSEPYAYETSLMTQWKENGIWTLRNEPVLHNLLVVYL